MYSTSVYNGYNPEEFTFTTTINNSFNFLGQPYSFKVRCDIIDDEYESPTNGQVLASYVRDVTLTSNEETELVFFWVAENRSINRKVRIVVDPEDKVDEWDEDNNIAERSFWVYS